MNNIATITEVIDAFEHRGFEFVATMDDGWFKLRGPLTPPRSDRFILCEVQIDSKFLELPCIRLLEIPPELPAVVPHLGKDGGLCYIAKGTVVLDTFDPIGQSLACLERATQVFVRILKGEMIEDLTEEFFAYWQGMFCMVDIQGEVLGRLNCIIAEYAGSLLWFVTDDEDRTKKKLNAIGYEATDWRVLTYRVKTHAQPRPLVNNWPPRTVGDILVWQSTLDPNCRRKIYQRLKEGDRDKAKGALIIVESPLMTYGFSVFYDRHNRSQMVNSKGWRNSIYGLEVNIVSVVRIDDRYLAQRNIPALKTLEGKRIAIIGCGTIGGYLSEMLVKAGAGTSDGKLVLVDFDILLPQNLGRHRLGFPHLLSNKASSMEEELKRLAPGANICALPVDVTKAQLENLDLLIDATGEETLGHWLCGKYLPHTSMLSVWIEGAGIAVRGLLRTSDKGGCYRCLYHSNREGEFCATEKPLPAVLAGHGCEGLYVPFPASVSVHAASLGAEMTLDWVNGISSPTLRTILTDRSQELVGADCDFPQNQDCPVCNS